MEFDELMDQAFDEHVSTYTITESNLDRISDYMAADIMNDFSEDFRQLIKIEILKRYNSFYDVMRERGNGIQ